MHKKNKRKKHSLSDYARILIVVSLTILLYGLFLDVQSDKKLFGSIDDIDKYHDGKKTVNITTSDGSQVVPGNVIVGSDDDKESSGSGGKSSSGEKGNNNANTSNSNTNNIDNHVQDNTPEGNNNRLRVEIQNTYGISVKYGAETNGYSVGGFSTAPIQDPNVIYDQLNHLKNALSTYPSGLFNEIKNGGIPLTVYLISNYSNNSITGVTDSSYTYAIISIAAAHPFEESFYHESYHYIERYMFKRGANFNNWDSINPAGFTYGIVDYRLSYTYGNDANAPFVNDYAQTSGAEDRASTFEYMMASNRFSCLNRGTIIHTKASQMALTMDAVLNTVNPNVTEYWERYL